jgi:plastocyanin
MTSRRTVLGRLAAVGLAVTAGCVGENGGQTDAGPTPTPTAEPAAMTEPMATTEPTTTANATATTEPTTAATGGETVDVAAGPEGRLRFDPDTVEIAVGDTVRWTFESAGHNVTTKPGASTKVRVPEGAEPFASYEDDQHYAINEVGSTFEHTFTVPGEYVYVCAPHEDQGMVGTVLVAG